MRVSLLALMLISAAAFAEDINPGQWELKLQTEAGGMTQSQVLRQCLTEADARDPGKLLIGSGSGALGCTLSDQRRSSGHIDFSVSCGTTPAVAGRGSVDFTPTTLEGTVELEFRGDGANAMTGGFRSRLSGQRIGSC